MARAVDCPCEALLQKGALTFACGHESECWCELTGPVCLEHSHLTGCCQRMFWPEDANEAAELGWVDGIFEQLFPTA